MEKKTDMIVVAWKAEMKVAYLDISLEYSMVVLKDQLKECRKEP